MLITGAGLLLLLAMPLAVVPGLLLALVVNAAGAVGDLVTAGWLLTQPKQAYVNDYGDGMAIYYAENCDRIV